MTQELQTFSNIWSSRGNNKLQWCDILQHPSDAINWSTIYDNNYYATNDTKLRSFQIRLNLTPFR